MTKLYFAVGVLAVTLLLSVNWLLAQAQPTAVEVKLNADTFPQLRKQIKPQAGESRWMDVPWFLTCTKHVRRPRRKGNHCSSTRQEPPQALAPVEAAPEPRAVRLPFGPRKTPS